MLRCVVILVNNKRYNYILRILLVYTCTGVRYAMPVRGIGLLIISVKLKLTLTLSLTLTDTGGAVLTLMLGYRLHPSIKGVAIEVWKRLCFIIFILPQ